jgi:hypothetical protein
MKSLRIFLIVILLLLAGYVLFGVGVILFKITVGLVVLALIASGFFIGRISKK